MEGRDSYKEPYLIKQINGQPANTKGGYPDLLIDNTEKDIVIVWSDQHPDPQVIHIERKHLGQFLKVIEHCKKGKDQLS